MSKFKLSLAAAAAAATALLLAACGGNGGDDPAPIQDPTVVPTSASGSTASWVAFAKALAPTESAEALLMGGITTLPISETEEPLAL